MGLLNFRASRALVLAAALATALLVVPSTALATFPGTVGELAVAGNDANLNSSLSLIDIEEDELTRERVQDWELQPFSFDRTGAYLHQQAGIWCDYEDEINTSGWVFGGIKYSELGWGFEEGQDDPCEQRAHRFRGFTGHENPGFAATKDDTIVWQRYDWVPDGTGGTWSKSQLVESHPDGSNLRVRNELGTGPGGMWFTGIAASPTADILFLSSASLGTGRNGIYRSVNGALPTMFLPWPNQNSSNMGVYDVSPDGAWLLYWVRLGVQYTMHAIRTDGSGGSTAALATYVNDNPRSAVFSPDMEHIAFIPPSLTGMTVQVADITVGAGISIDPGTARVLGSAPKHPYHLSWRATAGAPFTWKAKASDPAHIDFRSLVDEPNVPGNTATDPDTPGWDYGDGTTSITEGHPFATFPSHVYAKPGEYTVRHTVTTTTAPQKVYWSKQTITIPKPKLRVGISIPADAFDADNHIPLDAEFDTKITVRADKGAGTVRDVSFVDDVLVEASQSGVLEFDTEDIELPDGLDEIEPSVDVVEISVPTTAVARADDLVLHNEVTGADANGDQLTAEGETVPFDVGHDMQVTVTTTPQSVELERDADEDAPTPKPVSVKVEVENVSDSQITTAKVTVDPVIVDALNRDPTAAFPLQLRTWGISGGASGTVAEAGAGGDPVEIPLGTLNVGAKRTITFVASAVDGGTVDVEAIARGTVQAAPIREGSGADTATVDIDQDKLLLVKRDSDAPVQAKVGDTYQHHGVIENLSATRDLEVRVLTRKIGNVIGDPMYELLEADRNPLGIIRTLEPGERMPITGRYTSHPDGGTVASIELIVEAWYTDRDECPAPLYECHVGSGSTQMLVQTGQPQAGGTTTTALKRKVAIDTSIPKLPVRTYAELGWIFTDSFARGFGTWVDGTAELVQTVGGGSVKLAIYPFYLTKMMLQGRSSELIDQAAAQTYSAVQAIKRFDPATAKLQVDAMVTGALTPAVSAWDTGDSATLVQMSGTFLGGLAPELVIEAAVPALAAKKLVQARGATIIDEVSDAQKASKASRVESKGLKGFKAGDAVTPDEAFRFWGMDELLDSKLMRYAKDKGLVIAMRDRSPGSVEWLKRGAHPKIEMVKAKNVNKLDVDFLGFAPDHKDLVVIKEMRPWIYYESRLPGGISDELKTKIKARWEQRHKEWGKESKKYLKYHANGRVPVPSRKYGLNAVDNGIKDPKSAIWDSKKFELKTVSSPDGSLTYMPQMNGGKAGDAFQPFTGDMDLLAITDEAGNILPTERRKEVYKELAAMGFQHPESLTWDNVAGRAGYIGDYDVANANSEAMLSYLPDGTRRAVKFDSRHSMLDDLTPTQAAAGAWMFMEGLDLTLEPKPVTAGELSYPEDPETDVDLYMGLGTDGKPAVFSGDPNAPLIRRNMDGTFSRWIPGQGWEPWDPPAGTVVASLPQTATTVGTSAGETRIQIHEQGAMTDALGTAPALWFQPGMRIVIDPGGPNEEYAVVAALGSIIVSAPLQKAHAPGELIGVVPGTWNQPAAQQPPPTIASVKPAPGAKAPTITGKLVLGGKLTCAPGSWSGTAPISHAYQWQTEKRVKKGKRTVVTWPAIKRATAAKYTITKANLGGKIRCQVTARNTAGTTTRFSAAKSIPKPKPKRPKR